MMGRWYDRSNSWKIKITCNLSSKIQTARCKYIIHVTYYTFQKIKWKLKISMRLICNRQFLWFPRSHTTSQKHYIACSIINYTCNPHVKQKQLKLLYCFKTPQHQASGIKLMPLRYYAYIFIGLEAKVTNPKTEETTDSNSRFSLQNLMDKWGR